MKPLDFKRISEILDAVIDAPAHLRESVLLERCGADHALRTHLEAMLSNLEADEFLAVPVLSQDSFDAGASVFPPQRIGPYELLRLLGEGGMGSVYEARQDNPRRLVAVKILRAGLFSSESLRRFMRESQVLGVLHHPGIAQVYEAGTANTPVGSVPYFAMELIRGQPLAAFLADRSLSVRMKLELLAQACDAVEHAHQQGVVHRDLKPANIMVESGESDDPQYQTPPGGRVTPVREQDPRAARVKILDFGVARATAGLVASGATIHTDAGQIIGTLPYISPEQVAGDPTRLDARSDVYALGVIAYEMLAGRLPIDVRGRSIPDATHSIVHDEPTRLRSIDIRLAGDVDTIVAKAMEKDPARRYQSAAALASDIRRYLRDQPIVARPATHWYQLRKFARRNRAVVVGVSATLVTLLAGAATSTFWALRATDGRALAERRADELLRKAYRASIAAAQSSLERGQTIAARGHLASTPDVLRGWEWEYLFHQLDRSDRRIATKAQSHVSAVLAGEFALIVNNDRARLLNWVTGQETPCDAAGPIATPYALAVSPRRDTFVVCGEIASAIWNARTGSLIKVLQDEPRFESAPFAPDGSFIALGASSPGRVIFVDPLSGETLRRLDLEGIQRAYPTVSPDGKAILVEIRDGVTALIRLADQQQLWSAPGVQPRFSPDGQSALVYTGLDSKAITLHVIDTSTGKELRSLLMEQELMGRGGACSNIVTMSPDGSMLAHLNPSGSIRLLDSINLTTLATLTGLGPRFGGIYNGVTFSDDGDWLAGYSRHDEIMIWNIDRSATWAQLPNKEEVQSIAAAISPDGLCAVTGNWGQIVAWDLATGGPMWAISPSFEFVTSVAIGPDASHVYVAGDRGNILMLETASGKLIRSAAPYEIGPFGSSWCRSLATASASTTLAGFADGTLMSLDARTLECAKQAKLGASVWAIKVAPGAGVFACIVKTEPARVVVADLETLTPIAEVAMEGAQSLAWSSDASLLAVGRAGGVTLLAPDGKIRGEMRGPAGGQSCVCFSSDDSRVIAGSNDGIVSLWFTASCDLALELPFPRQDYSLAVAYSDERRGIHLVTSADPAVSFEIDKPDDRTAHARDLVRRGRDLYRRCKSAAQFLPETLAAIEHAPGISADVRAEAVRQARLLCEHPAWLNNQAYNRTVTAPNEATLRQATRENEAALAGSPDPFARLTRGKVLHRAGRFAEAIEAIREGNEALRALRPNWGDGTPEISAIIGLCEAGLGNADEAERWFAIFDRVVSEPRFAGGDYAIQFTEVVAQARASLRNRDKR